MSTLSDLKALEASATSGPWYAVENDLIGGWLIANVDKPASQLNRDPDQDNGVSDTAVADYAWRADAEFICALRNAWPEISEALQAARARK